MNIKSANPSAVHLLCQDIVQTRLSVTAVGALEGVGHATFKGKGAKKHVQKNELVVFCKVQQ